MLPKGEEIVKQRSADALCVLLTLGLLLAAGLYALFWPQDPFSASERRYRASAPAAVSLEDWQTDRETEQYLGDRVPFRQALVGLDSVAQVYTGRRTQLASWPVADSLIEPPVEGDADTVRNRLARFGQLADQAGAPWYVLVPPTHGSLLLPRMNPLMQNLYRAEEPLFSALAENPHVLPLREAFSASDESVYYRTDHHWTLAGAYLAYREFCAAAGRTALAPDGFSRQSFPGFRGTTASRSGLIWRGPDTLDCAQPAGNVTLTVRDEETSVYPSLIFPEQASGWDGYAVYLNGNHSWLEIDNPDAPEGTLLVFKDSFANCLLPLLSGSYRKVIAVDARYWSGTFSEAAAAADADDMLFCFSADSLVHDTMVARKAR